MSCAMGTKHFFGIEFSSSWIRVASARATKAGTISVRVSRVPLQAGSINESSGAIEDSAKLRDALRWGLSVIDGQRGVGALSIVVPSPLCYSTSFFAPGYLRHATHSELKVAYPVDLPGDSASLLVDLHAGQPNSHGERSVMLLAARRSAIEGYMRLFEGREWLIGVITTGAVARFNRWKLQHDTVSSQVALICSTDADARELSVWDRGVLVASESRGWGNRSRAWVSESARGSSRDAERTAAVASEIVTIIKQRSQTERPIECVLFGGGLRTCRQLHEQIARATGILCEASAAVVAVQSMELSSSISPSAKCQIHSHEQDTDRGEFDDVIGSLAPTIVALRAKKRRARWC